MKRVVIESPFAPRTLSHACGKMGIDGWYCCNEGRHVAQLRVEESVLHARYLDACLLDSLRRGEAPFASHGLYTRPGVLDDLKPEDRNLGITAGFVWRKVADSTVCYTDLGWSGGMRAGYRDAGLLIQLQMTRAPFPPAGPFHKVEEDRSLGGEWEEIGRELRKRYPR